MASPPGPESRGKWGATANGYRLLVCVCRRLMEMFWNQIVVIDNIVKIIVKCHCTL